MKLSKVYSSNNTLFQPIEFLDGLNVLYANVTRPKEDDKDSHNLGKTLLIHLLDFLLLKGISKGHFLYDQKELFSGTEFYLELRLNYGSFVTIKRAVENSTKISIKQHPMGCQNCVDIGSSEWDHSQIPIDKAVSVLNDILALDVLQDYTYRKGISYFLRTQADYNDVFQLNKFQHGKHSEWKPYLAMLLGFDHKRILAKYQLDTEIGKKVQFRVNYQREAGTDLSQLDKLKGLIDIRRSELDEIRGQAERFNFYAQEQKINTELISEVETSIASRNERLYTVNYEIQSIVASSKDAPNFDLKKIARLFAETKLYFPEQLQRNYEELLEFNRRMSDERNQRLQYRRQQLMNERGVLQTELELLNRKRGELIATLQEEEWFQKFRAIQTDLVRREGELARLESDLERIDVLSRTEREIREMTSERGQIIADIQDNVNAGNPIYLAVRSRFNNIIKSVLELPALLSTTINGEGNIEFEANIIQDELSAKFTSEGKGTSYKKLLCAAFDMALLETYADKRFYRFVYHDGILEGLDNRKKQRFLRVIEQFCNTYQLQYILTVIDADLPRDTDDKKVSFPNDVIIKEFHEASDEGRLFNMPKF